MHGLGGNCWDVGGWGHVGIGHTAGTSLLTVQVFVEVGVWVAVRSPVSWQDAKVSLPSTDMAAVDMRALENTKGMWAVQA